MVNSAEITWFHRAPVLILKANAVSSSQTAATPATQLGVAVFHNIWTNPASTITLPVMMILVSAAPVMEIHMGLVATQIPASINSRLANLD
jgi:hypothetical protein